MNALYEHYAFPMKDLSGSEPAHVEMTVGTASLPADVPADAHDVASAFKKFLWDIPGGILGSIALFKALRAILTSSLPDAPRNRLLALAFLSVKSSRRFDLISAVFGLLNSLKRVDGPLKLQLPFSAGISCQEQMTPRAFGVVFAPLLLGELTQSVDFAVERSPSPKKSIFHLPKPRQPSTLDRTIAIGAEKERITACSSVVETLVASWDDIARQMHFLETVLHKPLPTPRIRFKENHPLGPVEQTSPLSHISESSLSAQSTPKFTMLYSHTSTQQGAPENFQKTPVPAEAGPTVSRSVSVAGASLAAPLPMYDHARPLVHSATAVDLRLTPRWPSPQPTYRSQHASSATHLPWWERGTAHHVQLSLLTVRPGSAPMYAESTRSAGQPLNGSCTGSSPTKKGEPQEVESPLSDRRPLPADDPQVSNDLCLDGTSALEQELPFVPHGDHEMSPLQALSKPSAQVDARKSSHNSSQESSRYGSQKLKVSALYDEILKLQQQLHVKTEEIRELRTPKEYVPQYLRQSAIVQTQPDLEEMKREVEWWKARAQRAEATVRSCTRRDSANAIRMRWKRADSEFD